MLYLFEQQYSMPGRKRLGYLFTAWRYSVHPKVCPRHLVNEQQTFGLSTSYA
jgi:hypothetical protein